MIIFLQGAPPLGGGLHLHQARDLCQWDMRPQKKDGIDPNPIKRGDFKEC